MDEADLRKQITEQVEEQFDRQLREMRRDKMNLEEEFETASQRWRSERRRMNGEIERLEEALLSRNPLSGNPDLQEAVDERVRQASAEWAAERQQLKDEVSRLEKAVTEAIARSSNPMRSTQPMKDQFEVKLSEAEGLRLRVEREFLYARSTWEEEKKKLMAELMKLRRMIPSSGFQIKEVMDRLHTRTESMEEARIRELEGQLTESRATILRYHEGAIKNAQELASAKKEIQELNGLLTQIREEINSGSVAQLRHEYAANVQDLVQKNEQLAQELQGQPRISPSNPPLSAAPAQRTSLTSAGAVDGEIDRIRKSIDEIAQFLDDPDTSVSTIARKNIEKNELEAYLRGLLFSAGRAQAV